VSVKDSFDRFKSFVAGLEYSPDTLALDKALGEASNLLYDTRIKIDVEWAKARSQPARRAVSLLSALGITDDEIADALAAVREQNSGDRK